MTTQTSVKSVAVIGAGASGICTWLLSFPASKLTITGAITAAALKAENYFDKITVFERRGTPGGTWSVGSSKITSSDGQFHFDVFQDL
jgi:cation diffusion facilitator CzcD-associated flavoprotein CzcO